VSKRDGGPLPGEGPRRAEEHRRTWKRADRARPWVIAHRGDSFHAPENTLEAAELAWQAGADAWELDVQLSRDGVPVVLHDPSLLRTTDVAHRFAGDPRAEQGFLVADFDLAELKTLDAGGWFLDPAGGARSAVALGTLDTLTGHDRARFGSGEVRIPTLADALAVTERLDWFVNIELKAWSADQPGLVEAVLALLDTPGQSERVAISSFDHADVARVARLRPEIATGVLSATPLWRPESYVRDWVGADAYHASTRAVGAGSTGYRRAPSARRLRFEELESLRLSRVPVYVFTVNDASANGLADHLAEAGVAGLFTDDPRALRAHWPH
jgi:glycerophosphoryl diester phosphodiesterase